MDHQIGFWALLISAVMLGIGHSAAPDHWAPFAAIARSQEWSLGKTSLVSAFAGFGHVTASALLGLVGLFLGIEMIQAVGARFEGLVGYLLIAFGFLYALWGWRSRGRHHHRIGDSSFEHHHPHSHADHDHVREDHDHAHSHEHKDMTPLALFVLFSLDPCVAVVPIIFAAAALGTGKVIALVVAYEIATISAIVSFSCLAFLGAHRLRWSLLDTHGAVAAGLFIALVGILVQAAGI